MKYKIGDLEFDGETTLAEVQEKIKTKQEFQEFANQTFKTKSNEESLQEIINNS